ncbi:MAG: ATP-binding protein [Bacteroidetes bacterium]|nr:MAG: ATP-binding protein [Bacteroidota bacterium]
MNNSPSASIRQILDLNIADILESWTVSQAVRELLANALDEQVLSNSEPIQILKGADHWEIRDFGRGIKPEHFVLSENPEKLRRRDIIGKFGFGLKDALGTLFRHGAKIEIHSKHGHFSLVKQQKQGLDEKETLHVVVMPPIEPNMRGTAIRLYGLTEDEMMQAKNMFLHLADPPLEVLDTLPMGQIIRYTGKKAPIFVNGLQVGEESGFLFGYNIIAPSPALQRAMNRERRHVGRTAYVSQVKELLQKSDRLEVSHALAQDFANKPTHEELTWLPVQEHTIRILNRERKYVFYKEGDAFLQPALLDEARNEGLIPLELPKKLWRKVVGKGDYQQAPILTLEEYARQREANFRPEFVPLEDLAPHEQTVWETQKLIFEAIGGRPAQIRDIRVAERIELNEKLDRKTVGLWEPSQQRITILRSQLASMRQFTGTLLHEIAHATSGADDCTRRFESELTNLLGKVGEALCERLLSPADAKLGALH